MARKFGWKRDKVDIRDWKFKALLKHVALAEVPAKVDLTEHMTPVENQQDIGSCTANAVVGAMEYLEWKRTNKRWLCFKQYRDLSRLFVYYNTRLMEGTVEEDAGATIRGTVKSLAKYGVCDERIWPYETDKWDDRPKDQAYDKALQRCVKDYYRVDSLDEIMQALALGFPVSFGAMIYDSFMSVGGNGNVTMPAAGEASMGGHAMLIVGYDRNERQFLVRNSWGTQWGDNGYCRFPFAYIDPVAGLSGDLWVIRS